MKVFDLQPKATNDIPFSKKSTRFIREVAGCYVLTTFDGIILYIGLSKNLQRRFCEHLDNAEKIKPTKNGRATKFFYIQTEDLEKTERTWLNLHYQYEGELPILNKNNSPVST